MYRGREFQSHGALLETERFPSHIHFGSGRCIIMCFCPAGCLPGKSFNTRFFFFRKCLIRMFIPAMVINIIDFSAFQSNMAFCLWLVRLVCSRHTKELR